jgi:hypothetical protein
VMNLFGIAFQLDYSELSNDSRIDVEISEWMGDDLIHIIKVDSNSKKIGIGIIRKAGQDGIYGSGTVAMIRMRSIEEVSETAVSNLGLQKVIANAPAGIPISFNVNKPVLTSIVENEADIPTEFTLKQNYPNPFNPTTTIEYAIPKQANGKTVRLEIFNTVGEKVKTLINE